MSVVREKVFEDDQIRSLYFYIVFKYYFAKSVIGLVIK